MIQIKSTTDINSTIYRDGLEIRYEVFVKEQNVPQELELENEARNTYFVLYVDDKAAAVARYFPTDNNGIHIQRVAVRKDFRKQGLASKLLNYITDQAKKDNYQYAILGAQDQASDFYRTLGFTVVGEQYLDAGIKHHDMRKDL